MSTLATDVQSGDGSTTVFTLAFEFLSRDDVTVSRLASTDPDTATGTTLTVIETGTPTGDQYAWTSDTQIQLGTAPTSDQKVKFERNTPNDSQVVEWNDGSFLIAEDLNDADLQLLYLIQELTDRVSADEARAGLAEAPDDGAQYGRQSKAWTKTLVDAASDNKLYGRQDGAWVEVPPDTGIPDVTETGQFVRETGKWTAADFLRDADSDNSIYGRRNGEWQSITISGINYRGTVDATQAAPAAQNGDFYVNTATSGRPDATWAGIADVDLTGGERLIYTQDTQQWQVLPAPQVQNASETTRGVIELATQAETDTATDDFRAVTPLKLRTGYVPRDLDLLDTLPDSGGGGGGDGGGDGGGGDTAVTVTSTSFASGDAVNARFYPRGCGTGGGQNDSPQLGWSVANLPDGRSVASWQVRCDDISLGEVDLTEDALHWQVRNIPANTTSIAENGTWADGVEIVNGGVGARRANGWDGPCPPQEAADGHTYEIRVTAVLDDDSTVVSEPYSFTATTVPPAGTLTLSSTSFTNNAAIGADFYYDQSGCTGQNNSPQFSWSLTGLEAGRSVASYQLTVFDEDADSFLHWRVVDIPSSVTSIPENGTWAQGTNVEDNGWGEGLGRANGWGGPCPPAGETHNYEAFVAAVLDNGKRIDSQADFGFTATRSS